MSSDTLPDGNRDLFNRGTLELTFKLLRKQYPALALQIQNALIVYPRNDYHAAFGAEELPLTATAIAAITQALIELSDELTNGRQRGDAVIVRSLLLDWLMLARDYPSSAA